jgi:hypothetical protein
MNEVKWRMWLGPYFNLVELSFWPRFLALFVIYVILVLIHQKNIDCLLCCRHWVTGTEWFEGMWEVGVAVERTYQFLVCLASGLPGWPFWWHSLQSQRCNGLYSCLLALVLALRMSPRWHTDVTCIKRIFHPIQAACLSLNTSPSLFPLGKAVFEL